MLPGSGPFSRLAIATGVNHYIHYLKAGSQTFSRKGGIEFDVNNLIENIKSRLEFLQFQIS